MSTYEANRYSFTGANVTNIPASSVDLSNLNADNLTSGTVPDARFGTPTFDGSNITSVPVQSTTSSFTLGHSHVSLNVLSARYVKVGRVCTVHFYGENTSTSSGGGNTRVYFTGLPFTSWNSGHIVGGGNLSARHRFGNVGGWNLIVFNNSNRMYIRFDGAQKDTSDAGSDEMSIREDYTVSNKYFVGTCTYITAS